ncbi:MAG: ribonuclease III [Dehalococcoidia bacterium]
MLVSQLQTALGLKFKDPALLHQALVHRSYLNEVQTPGLESNERLEFLGDAVVGLIVSQQLCAEFPHLTEGALTQLKAALICAETLACVAERLSLGNYLLLGRGEKLTGGHQRPSNLARAFEALVGAVFLDSGLAKARAFVLRCLKPELAQIAAGRVALDSKSELQQVVQARWQAMPSYRTLAAEGPDHAKVFTVEVLVGDQALGRGQGRSKKEAESKAAQQALKSLETNQPAFCCPE